MTATYDFLLDELGARLRDEEGSFLRDEVERLLQLTMFDKYSTLIDNLKAAGLDARKSGSVFSSVDGALAIPEDTRELIAVQPLSVQHVVQWGKEKPQAERYQLLGMAKDETRAREILDEAIDDENASPAPALELPHYRQEASRLCWAFARLLYL